MTFIPSIEIFVRHSADCGHRDDERWKRCHCRKHLRWTWDGRQYRQSAKTRSWDGAERAKRELELKYEAAQVGKPVADEKPSTVEQAITAFLQEKTGARAAESTMNKYKLTLARFQEFCDGQNIFFVREVKLPHLSAWREEWEKYYRSAFALRNNQSRLRHFFRYCQNAGMIQDNPAARLTKITISDDDFKVDPFSEREYKAILNAIPKCDQLTAANRSRVSALMQLQRWAGLSLVDGVLLERNELIPTGGHFRVDTSRRKTGVRVSNAIPGWLGRELLAVKNGTPEYFFQTGTATAKSATSIYDKLYRKVFERAGIVNGGSHRFRHLFAVSLLEKGVDIRLVSKALGHKNLAVTERHYAKWSTKQQANLEKALAKAWGHLS